MTADSSAFDRPEVLMALFHPRRDDRGQAGAPPAGAPDVLGTVDVLVPVEADVAVGVRFHLAARQAASILFFHGNGEIAADYDDLGPVYTRAGINFLAADYRGYGRSGGRPTVAAMMRDACAVFRFVREWLAANRFDGPVFVMGRSLGSASALEIADHHSAQIAGLIIESGFARPLPLLKRLGIDPAAIGLREDRVFRHIGKISRWVKPLLIIHAEFDHIIPFSDGRALFDACPSKAKRLVQIPGADHNDIFLKGFDAYLEALLELVGRTP
jgi:alpha-beta hydrolase superfamily lysophospholipase